MCDEKEGRLPGLQEIVGSGCDRIAVLENVMNPPQM